MEETLQRQQYELAFHLSPSFSETEAEEKRREIEGLISQSGGLVSRYGEIKKIKLVYPIKKERFSNFGYIEFFAPKNAVQKINKDLLASDDILRHLMVKKEKERIAKPKLAKPKVPTSEASRIHDKETVDKKPKEERIKETEELDKKIEEILEKL
ncbi:MAG: 30S ribosomal protein S6 [Patescibacteria group bacterium]